MILRFLALYLWNEGISRDEKNDQPLQYKSNMDDFLGETMKFINRYSFNDSLILDLEGIFKETMKKACEFILTLGGLDYHLRMMERKDLSTWSFLKVCVIYWQK